MEKTAITIRYTRLWERLVAALVDMFLLMLPTMLWVRSDDYRYLWYLHLISAFVDASYYVLLEGPLGKGQSLGKRLMGIRAVRTDGSMLSYGDALKRYFFTHFLLFLFTLPMTLGWTIGKWGFFSAMISNCAVLYYLLDLVIMFRDPQRRAMHDYFSNTVVLKTGPAMPFPWPNHLTEPVPSIPWKRYWVGVAIVGFFFAFQTALTFKDRSRYVETPATPFQRTFARHAHGILIQTALPGNRSWHLDVIHMNLNPFRKKSGQTLASQKKLVEWMTRHLIDKAVIDSKNINQMIYGIRSNPLTASTTIWTVNTKTFEVTRTEPPAPETSTSSAGNQPSQLRPGITPQSSETK